MARVGGSGLKVSRVCLGTAGFGRSASRSWALDAESAVSLVRAALNRGINFFDTGPTYGGGEAEVILRGALRGVPRDGYVLTSKVYFQTSSAANGRGLSRKHIMSSIDATLARLGVDHVDIYMMHRWDDETPIEETLQALDDIVRAGKALYLGVSSMPAWRFMKALGLQRQHGWARFICMQNYYNLIYREEEREMIPLCVEEEIGVLPWSPLARGLLAGPDANPVRIESDRLVAQRFAPERDEPVIESLRVVSRERGMSMALVALAWLMHCPSVVAPVVGCESIEQLAECQRAAKIELSRDERRRLAGGYRPHLVMGY